jgi:ABC-type antimicrobial peptide transport system permease subunit
MPQNNYEVVANSDTYHIGDTVNGLKVVGLSNEVDSNVMYTDTVSRLKYYFNIFGYEYNPTLSFAITENSMKFFEDNGLIVITPYELMYAYEEEMLRDSQLTNIIFIIILFIFSLIYIYFSIRSKLINQIKVIDIYRSIGATRSQISLVYLARIIVQTTLTSVIGYVVVCAGYSFIAIKLASLGGNILFNTNFVPFYLFLGLVVLYLSHILFGLIPVWNLMRKTPAEINSKYDI